MTTPSALSEKIYRVGGNVADSPFWEGCASGLFRLHRCGVCGRFYWPASVCTTHRDQDMAWVETSGRGVVHTYTVLHHAYTPEMEGETPYVVAVVKLDEGPFFYTNIVGIPPDKVHLGMRVVALMRLHRTGLTLPVFQPMQALQSSTAPG